MNAVCGRAVLRRVSLAAALAVACGAVVGILGQSLPKPAPRPILILGGTIIDGTGAPPRRSDAVVIQDGRIKAMGLQASRRAPKDARTIDASGKWILPGLIDGDVRLYQTGGPDARSDLFPTQSGAGYLASMAAIRRSPSAYLRAYVCSGVTSVLNLGGPSWLFDLRDGRADDPLAPRILTSGPFLLAGPAPAPAARGDETLVVLEDREKAAAQVDRLARLGSDLVAIGPGAAAASGLAGNAALVKAAVSAAHARKRRAAAEVSAAEDVRVALDAGADVLVGSVRDQLDDSVVRTWSAARAIYVPAMAAAQSLRQAISRQLVVEPFERACAPEATLDSLDSLKEVRGAAVDVPPWLRVDALAVEQRNLQLLSAAGVTIAAGSGAGGVGALHGSALHRELALMAAGLSPMQVLLAATRDGARLTGHERDLGELKEGMLADLLLLDADPLADIRNTRRVFQVIKGGAIYER